MSNSDPLLKELEELIKQKAINKLKYEQKLAQIDQNLEIAERYLIYHEKRFALKINDNTQENIASSLMIKNADGNTDKINSNVPKKDKMRLKRKMLGNNFRNAARVIKKNCIVKI